MKAFALLPYPFSAAPDGGIQVGTTVSMLGDSSVVPDHHPFFIPDFAPEFVAKPALAIRIGRLGKAIEPRFAHRYVSEMAPALVITAPAVIGRLSTLGLPWTEGMTFDGSAPVGTWSKATLEEMQETTIRYRVEPLRRNTWTHDVCESDAGPASDIAESVAYVSRNLTLRIGDILLLGLSAPAFTLEQDTRVTALTGGDVRLQLKIK